MSCVAGCREGLWDFMHLKCPLSVLQGKNKLYRDLKFFFIFCLFFSKILLVQAQSMFCIFLSQFIFCHSEDKIRKEKWENVIFICNRIFSNWAKLVWIFFQLFSGRTLSLWKMMFRFFARLKNYEGKCCFAICLYESIFSTVF